MSNYFLKPSQKYFLILLSFCMVAFGQPAWMWWLGLIAAVGGYACFWRVLLSMPSKMERFFTGMSWFTCVQIVQLSWAVSHPYLYIYALLLVVTWCLGAQWGILSLFITPQSINRMSALFAIAGGWVLLEWSRLLVLSGFPFGPVGLALTGSIYSLQFAAIGGIYLLTFWVMITNLVGLCVWINHRTFFGWLTWGLIAFIPYGFGWMHIQWHTMQQVEASRNIEALLVQTVFPVEEKVSFANFDAVRHYVLGQWKQIFKLISPHRQEGIELIVLPENLVPYGTYALIFHYQSALEAWTNAFGPQAIQSLPALNGPYADFVSVDKKNNWYVNNAYFAQAIANLFQAHVVIGLEDQLYIEEKQEESYSAALHFYPQLSKSDANISRYEKRVLVPMGEYIPFECCRTWAAKYGVYGSFTHGKTAKLFNGPIPLGPSICYEEAFGHLMRDNRLKGAELLVNITNDGWYPHSKLPQQHFDHSRLRSIENGVPLVRACNTGITGAIDSLGRVVGIWGRNVREAQEKAGALRISVPTYHFHTLYTFWGDYFILGVSLISILFGLITNKWKS